MPDQYILEDCKVNSRFRFSVHTRRGGFCRRSIFDNLDVTMIFRPGHVDRARGRVSIPLFCVSPLHWWNGDGRLDSETSQDKLLDFEQRVVAIEGQNGRTIHQSANPLARRTEAMHAPSSYSHHITCWTFEIEEYLRDEICGQMLSREREWVYLHMYMGRCTSTMKLKCLK